jgi:anti-sigma B factor antagonist
MLDPIVGGGTGAGAEVVIDLSSLSFLDSSGIAVLVTGQQKLVAQGRRLVVRGARTHALKVFEIAGLVEFLHVETEAEGSPTR